MALVGAFQILPAIEYGRLARRWAGAPEPLEWVRGKLVKELQLETRQTEGPYNIVAMELSLEDARPAVAGRRRART